MIVYCVFIHGEFSCEEPITFPCRMNVGDGINPVFVSAVPFDLPEGGWIVTKCEFFNNASEISQRVHLTIKS